MVSEFFMTIHDNKMVMCPLCAGTKIGKPQHKRETANTPPCLAYPCLDCGYTQYVHTPDSKFLKSVNIEPTNLK